MQEGSVRGAHATTAVVETANIDFGGVCDSETEYARVCPWTKHITGCSLSVRQPRKENKPRRHLPLELHNSSFSSCSANCVLCSRDSLCYRREAILSQRYRSFLRSLTEMRFCQQDVSDSSCVLIGFFL